MGVPDMEAFWNDLSARKQAGKLGKTEEKFFKKWVKALGYLSADPRHNSLGWKFLQATRLVILPPRHRTIRMVGASGSPPQIRRAELRSDRKAKTSAEMGGFIEPPQIWYRVSDLNL